MSLVHRFLLILFFCIPATFSNTANADYPKTFLYYQSGNYGTQNSSYEPICIYLKNRIEGYGYSITSYQCTETRVNITYWDVGYNQAIDIIKKYGSCNGVVSEWGNGMCAGNPPTCTAPQVWDSSTGTCETPCVAGCNGACGSYYSAASQPSQACINKCYYNTLDGIASSSGGGWVFLVGNNTGQKCSTSDATQPPPACPECDCIKQGKTYGTVNGAVVCVAKGTPNSAHTTSKDQSTSSSTTTNKDASGATTNTDSTSQTKSESQSVNGDKVTTTTTTTTTNADGTSTQNQTEKTESIGEYCKNNPSAPLCAQKTDCDKYPDSVGCKKSSDFIKDLIGEAGADTETIQQKGVTIGSDFNFNPVSLPSSSGCPAPVTVSLAGRSVTLSYSWLCSYASAFKPLVTAFALFLAYGIVASALRSESNKAAA